MSSSVSDVGDAYDVFLSFRGLDTRQGFADTLYNILVHAGIRVFRDDNEMRPGDRLDQTILQAVRSSKICIPIFSQNYAHSKWCLKELAEMVKWKKMTVPILFDVEPQDVKLQTELYRDQLNKHDHDGHHHQEVQVWREALKEVGRTKLSMLQEKGHYDFCEALVKEDISYRLKMKQKTVPDYLVGLEDELELATKLMNEVDAEVLLVIHGIGGVGKTTLAKLLFNQLSPSFDHCTFVEGIRETSRSNGIEHLQKLLLSDLSDRLKDPIGIVDPMVLMKSNFSSKKVLIVLDDVVEKNQIDNLVGKLSCFGSGSRIIVTTRDKRVVNIERHESSSSSSSLGRKRVIRTMEIWGLTPPLDLQLFSLHALGSDAPPKELLHLSKEVISTMQGLPLALEVVGSSLRGKFNSDNCKSIIERLKVTPDPEVKKILKTSFDALEEREQQIFLDIACFFIPNNGADPYLSEQYLQLELETLLSMSLIRHVGETKVLGMHDQIRDMGRDIARNRSSKLSKNCRLWVYEEAVKTLKGKRDDNENIISLRLDEPCSGDFSGDEFVRFSNLKLLSLKEPNFVKGFKTSFPLLTYLSMHSCPATLSTAKLDDSLLVVLDLAYSTIDSKWKGWKHLQTTDLKVLDLSHCINLTSTPDLSKMRRLEKLVLEGCSSLKKIQASKDSLKKLRHLNLKGCDSLTTLPKEIFASGNLEWLSLRDCRQITKLPDSIQKSVPSLLTLDLSRTSVKEIKVLGGLELSLVTLDLSQSSIQELPESIGKLTRLEKLLLSECKELSKLPDSVGDLQSLKVLTANFSSITRLPTTIGKLKNLERLEMEHSALRKLPMEIGDVSGLRKLNLSGTVIRQLPSTLSLLSCLATLELVDCDHLRQLPSTLSLLSCLATLELVDCDHLRQLTDLPVSLTKLHVKSRRLKKVPDLTRLGSLTDLKLIDGSSLKRWTRLDSSCLRSITRLSKLIKLELHLSNLTNLPSNLKALTQLESVVIHCPSFKSFPELPSSVVELTLLSISSGVRVRHLSALSSLKVLKIQGFTDLSSLHLPNNLESLSLCNCPSLPSDFLSNAELKKLTNLEVVRCSKVVEISGLETAEFLEKLTIENCELLEKIGHLSKSEKLLHLKVIDCPKAKNIRGLNQLTLKSTDFSGSDFLTAMKMSKVSVALSMTKTIIMGIPGSDFVRAKFAENEELYEKTRKFLNMSDEAMSVRLPGSKFVVKAYVTHKHKLHRLTGTISTKLATKMFGNSRRDADACNQITRQARRDDCYLTWLERSEDQQDLASEKEWSEYDESESEDDVAEVDVGRKYPDISSLLVSPGRDFFVRNNGSQIKIDKLAGVTLYFATSWSVRCLMLTIMMATEYSSDKTPTRSEVVFISMDEDEESFQHHFSMMPWLAIPYSDAEKRNSLVELFQVKKVPQLVIIDEDGNVTFDKCEGPREICPCPPERLIELKQQKEAAQRDQSLRSILVHDSSDFVISLTQGEIIPISKLEGKTICLFFPSFSEYDNDIHESLSRVYETLKENGGNFEIVMVVPGRYDEDTIWEDLMGSCNGYALLVHPNVFGHMISYFKILSLPALVMIGTDGKTLLPSAVEAIQKYGASAYPFTSEKLTELKMQTWSPDSLA